MSDLHRHTALSMGLVVVLATSAGVAVAAGAAAPSPSVASQAVLPAANSVVLSAADQDQLGLHIYALPAAAKAALVSEGSAASSAATFLTGITGSQVVAKPDEVLHVLAAPDASSAERSVYVFIWRGGDPFPGGPEGNVLHATTYRGVVVDDQTGEVLRSFAAGTI
jgi:hypothetical protein